MVTFGFIVDKTPEALAYCITVSERINQGSGLTSIITEKVHNLTYKIEGESIKGIVIRQYKSNISFILPCVLLAIGIFFKLWFMVAIAITIALLALYFHSAMFNMAVFEYGFKKFEYKGKVKRLNGEDCIILALQWAKNL